MLTFEEVDAALKDAPGPSILICAENIPRVSTFLPVARHLTDRGFAPVLVLPPEVDAASLDLTGLKVAVMALGLVKSLSGADIFLSSENGAPLGPRSAKRVSFFHSLPDDGSQRDHSRVFRVRSDLVREVDFFILGSRQPEDAWNVPQYAEWIDKIFPAALLQGRADTMQIIPGGYPKIEVLRDAAKGIDKPDRILFCPTNHTQPHSIVEEFGERAIQFLLDSFPDLKVVFRPYPQDIEHLRGLAQTFDANDRFIYDTSVNGEEHAIRAVMAVTDGSSAAVTFSLATGRPSVHFRKRPGIKGKKFHPIGTFARSFDQMCEQVLAARESMESRRELITAHIGDVVYQPYRSLDYLTDIIPDIVAGRSRSDWLQVPRTPWVETPEQSIDEYLINLEERTDGGKWKGNVQTLNLVRDHFKALAKGD